MLVIHNQFQLDHSSCWLIPTYHTKNHSSRFALIVVIVKANVVIFSRALRDIVDLNASHVHWIVNSV